MDRFFAVVNPAAGGGRSAKLAGPALARVRKNCRLTFLLHLDRGTPHSLRAKPTIKAIGASSLSVVMELPTRF
jgi:hypothetical protein